MGAERRGWRIEDGFGGKVGQRESGSPSHASLLLEREVLPLSDFPAFPVSPIHPPSSILHPRVFPSPRFPSLLLPMILSRHDSVAFSSHPPNSPRSRTSN